LRILRQGGNAVDAAVAIGYTLAVTYPSAGNLGGGGFMTVRLANGDSHFVDFRETAPAAATTNMYLDATGGIIPDASTVGPLSGGVPGTVAGLEYARAKYGTRSRHELMRDAIDDAEQGFLLSDADAAVFARARKALMWFPTTAAILVAGGETPKAGSVFRQPDLAQTLHRIDTEGAAGSYQGAIAKELASAVRDSGGIITEADLAAYRIVERVPLKCKYHGVTIVTAPLPSSGGVTMCEIPGILANDRPAPPVRSFMNAHLEIEAERRAFLDRNTQLGDPAFVPSRATALLNASYLSRLRKSIATDRATTSSSLSPGIATHEGSNTTNYSVVDVAGNAVDVTYTLNNGFGSDFVAGSTGVLLNDEMDDFATKPGAPNMFGLVQGIANAIAPGKRPLSSMAPSVVVNGSGHPMLVVGAAGGPRIITTTLDAIRAVVDFHQDTVTALAAPRMHMQWLPDLVYAETATFDPTTLAQLSASGYTVKIGRSGTDANAVGILANGVRMGAHDPDSPTGAALAY
jgi:gamma-glutamyltranspeptidase/glutathione hydrolase